MSETNLEVEEVHLELNVRGLHLKRAEIVAIIAFISTLIVAVCGELYFRLYCP